MNDIQRRINTTKIAPTTVHFLPSTLADSQTHFRNKFRPRHYGSYLGKNLTCATLPVAADPSPPFSCSEPGDEDSGKENAGGGAVVGDAIAIADDAVVVVVPAKSAGRSIPSVRCGTVNRRGGAEGRAGGMTWATSDDAFGWTPPESDSKGTAIMASSVSSSSNNGGAEGTAVPDDDPDGLVLSSSSSGISNGAEGADGIPAIGNGDNGDDECIPSGAEG
jgi:hypothetical protein